MINTTLEGHCCAVSKSLLRTLKDIFSSMKASTKITGVVTKDYVTVQKLFTDTINNPVSCHGRQG